MNSLLWCFFSWRGELNRQQFALAMLFCVLVAIALGSLISDLTVGPTNNGEVWTRNGLMLAKGRAAAIAWLAVTWPLLCIQVKRLRHIGLPAYSLFIANIAVTLLLLVAAPLGLIGGVVFTLFIFFAKGGSISLPG